MKTINILIASLAVAAISSCSLIGPKSKPTSVSGEQATAVKTDNDKKMTQNTDQNLADRINGEWIIVTAAGQPVDRVDDMPYVTFEKQTGRVYASNGCNILNGSYALSADGRITFGNMLSTMKMCEPTPYETAITKALSGDATLSVKQLGHESYLTFSDAKGAEIITARKHNMDFLNGNWQITSVNGKAVSSDDATLFIDINELKVHGNTGCNLFNGSLFINPDKSNAIDFSNLASTRMMCPNMEQESAILLALEETVTAIQGSKNNVMLLNSAGKELMTLMSIPRTEE